LEDANDVIHSDPMTARILMNQIVEEVIKFSFKIYRKPLPRVKERLKELEILSPETYVSIISFLEEKSIEIKLEILKKVSLSLFGEIGFFEWETIQEKLE
jgi:hypothetical protein